MRYFTKEWYGKMQNTNFHDCLKIDERADDFSDDFYKELYNDAKKTQLEFLEDVLDYNNFKNTLLKFTDFTEEEIENKFKKVNEDLFQGMTPDEYFERSNTISIERLKNSIPENILNKVKDIRVLAFGYVSSEVYELIREYCVANEKFVEEKEIEYSKVLEEQFGDTPITFMQHSFHDCDIIDVYKDKDDLIIKLDNSDGFTGVEKLIFKNYNIILDESIKGCCWKYTEVYRNDDKYEVHILALSNTIDMTFSFEKNSREMIICCKEIIVE